MRAPSLPLVLAASLLAACGDDAPTQPDAPAGIDAAIDAPAGDGCDHAEAADLTNDDVPPATGSPEQTGLVIDDRRVVCGSFDHTHFDGDITVDVDGYVVTVAADTDVLVRIHGAGAETIDLVGIDVYGGAALDQLVGSTSFYGEHGVAALRLPAGTYEVVAFALAGAAIPASIPYRLDLRPDNPAARCSELTAGGYPEANDGASNDGNDVITIPSGAPPALTTAATDAPEPTGATLMPAVRQRLSGTIADIATPDQYEDKDTFAFATGAATNELAVQLAWPTAANLDMVLFEAGTAEPVVRAIATTASPEVKTFSVKPSTSYWLLVGGKAGGTGLPAAYGATLCPARFAP